MKTEEGYSEEAEKDRQAKLLESCKNLLVNEDWLNLVEDMKIESENYLKQSAVFLAKDRVEEAKELARIIEGIEIFIDRPDSVIAKDKSLLNQVKKNYIAPIKNWWLRRTEEKVNN